MNASLYPPSIQGAPPDLTTPSKKYRLMVVIVLISLLVFVLFYFGLLIGSGWLIVDSLLRMNAPVDEYGHSPERDGAIACLVLGIILFVFLVKALFKGRQQEEDIQIEITEQEHPELFGFIRRICQETHAPFPYRVFLAPDVNAAVFYNRSLLSLILPTRKNLLIGLGLVNGLNLSEFKAVLAHEFGHFSQSSMRLGSYVYTANRIIYDLVYQRDAFDTLLAKAKRVDLRIAIFAYIISAGIWVLRMVLQVAFKLINFFESALSRQMEFHADLVAVSLAGSDAHTQALKKSTFSHTCLMQAFHDLKDASEHKLYTHDLYYHQAKAVDHLRLIANDPLLGTVPALPVDPAEKTQVFTQEEDDEETGQMWASHPSHYEREKNAKRHYLRSTEDTRSPWLLFHDPDALRRRMTERFYQSALDLPATTRFAPPGRGTGVY